VGEGKFERNMDPAWKSVIKAVVPRKWRRLVRRLGAGPVFRGDYGSWAEARAASRGYEAPEIFDKALAAARAVRDGRAAFERDTVLFAQPAAHVPLRDALRRVAAQHGGQLNVVDFGGAFGSTWWQHRSWLEGVAVQRWHVVEQAHLVAAGQREFEVGPLRFHEAIDACAAAPAAQVFLLSSVLPYLETPHALLAEVARRGFRHVIIDRTGFVAGGRDRLTVQHVPASIYAASYPCWFFDRAALLRPLAAEYRIVAEWPTFDHADIAAEFRGLLLERIDR
jgi:putative methyltransferase (TIGR04325 family)